MEVRGMMWKVATRLVGLFAASSILVVAIPTGSASAGDGGHGVIEIVLLGDSYSSGNGAGNYTFELFSVTSRS